MEKVSGFCQGVAARDRADLTCQPGCSSCCQVWLSVCDVEHAQLRTALRALPQARRAELAARGRRELAREQSGASPARCAFLDADGRCAVYEHRPLVCRTQGLALRYPAGVIPEAAVRTKLATGEVTHCQLNYVARAPHPADVLNAERVDQLLGLVNVRFARAHGLDPHTRHGLSAIAAGAEDGATGG